MKKLFFCLLTLCLLLTVSIALDRNFNQISMLQSNENFVFATYVSESEQVSKVRLLIKSIRDNARDYSSCTIYVGIPDTCNIKYDVLISEGVKIILLDIPEEARDYYYAVKAYAASEIEKSLGKSIKTLAWFDPETIVVGPIDDLDLKTGYLAAIRPVFLMNKIGLYPEEKPNELWEPVYKYLNLNIGDIPIVETEVDLVKTRAYYNCGIFSVDPSLGIMQKWAEVQTVFLKDEEYQKSACSQTLRKVFFHQMIFSCVVLSKLGQGDICPLPVTCGYPLELHGKMPEKKKINKLNDISCAITEHIWENNPVWYKEFAVDEPLRSWLEKVYKEYLILEK